MVTELLLLPPAPVHVSVYVIFALSGPTPWEPETGFVPDHPPEAEQEVAFVEDQLSVELPLVLTVSGFAESETVGVPGAGAGAGAGVGVGVGVGDTEDVALVLVLASPAPPPQPVINAANNMSRNPDDIDCEIRGHCAASLACAMCMFLLQFLFSPNNVHAWTTLTLALAPSGNLRAIAAVKDF